MRLSLSKSPNATNLFVIEDVTVSGRRTTRVVEALGSVKDLSEKLNGQDPVEWARAYVKELNEKKKKDEETVIHKFSSARQIPKGETRCVQSGYLFLQSIYHGLGLPGICREIADQHKIRYDLDAILSRLVYARILDPSSKRSSLESCRTYLEPADVSLHQVYRALSLLSRHSEEIQAKVYKKSLELCERNTRVLYYDCTNYFFEIEQEDALRRYGQSKQHQPSPLVQMGLFMDGNGMPLSFFVGPGSQNEQTTLKPLEKRILKDFELSEFIVCTDAGLASTENRKYNDLQKRSYVVTQSIKQLKGHLKEWALSPTGWHLPGVRSELDISRVSQSSRNERIYYKERWINENGLSQRLVVTWSAKYQAYQRTVRARQVERAVKLIEQPAKLTKARPNDPKRFIALSHATKDGEAADQQGASLNAGRILEEERFDGFYGICTNLQGDVADILAINRRRWEIEECFYLMKSEFKARPVYLSREERIGAHFLTCFLALLAFRILEQKLKEEFTAPEILKTLRSMQMVPLDGKGYLPAYTRTDLTDALHRVFGFETDREVVTPSRIKKILKKSKDPTTLRIF